jgi:nucleotide-binding universal stress UspA family protein
VDTVFVATDLSDAADEALRRGHERAGPGARLVVCHVIAGAWAAGVVPDLSVLDLHRRVSDKIVRRTVAVTGRKASDFDVLLADGNPWASIVTAAEENRANLVVVGSHGATGIARVLLGSAADKVVRYAHCSVLIARPDRQTGRILVATDFSEPSLLAVAAAGRESRRTGAALTILHCIEGVVASIGEDLAQMVPPLKNQSRADEQMRRLANTFMEATLKKHSLSGACRVVAGAASNAIVAVCEELQPDLLVVGTRGLTGIRRVVLGSVAEAVARLAPCSVLIVREPADSLQNPSEQQAP